MIGGLSQSGGLSNTPPPKPKPPADTTPPEPSIWGRLGQLGKDAFGAVLAPSRFAWDVTQSIWNDDDSYNGIRNTLTTAGGNFFGRVIKPVADIGELPGVKPALVKLDQINRDYVREPLTTLELMVAERKDPLDGSAWSEAHKQAQNVSFGQGFVGMLGSTAFKYQAESGLWGEDVNKVNWNDPKSVQDYFDHGPQKIWSGVADTNIQIFGDLSIAAGKAAKIVRGSEMVTGGLTGADRAEKIADAIKGVAVAEDGLEVNKYTTLIDDFTKNDSLFAYNHPMLKDSPARSTLANALGDASTPKDVGLVLRAGLGDPNALAQIRAAGRADLANPIGKSLGELDAIDQWGLKGEKLPDGSPKFAWEDEAVHAEIGAEKAALEANNLDFNKFWSLHEIASTPGGVLTRTVGATPFQSVDRFVAMGRSAKFYDLPSTTLSRTEVFQPTPFHRMYQLVSWASGERPAGIVNLNDAESSREVVAVLKRGMKVANLGDEQARILFDRYLGSSTPEQRAEAVYAIERAIFAELSAKHGLTVETADIIYNNYKRARASAYSSLKERGYAVDLDGTVFKVPFYESQTANVLPMMDFDMANSVLRRHNLLGANQKHREALGWMLDGGSDFVNVVDTMQSLFKVGSLLRLGYMVRNSLEAQVRIAASLGATTSFRYLGKGMENLIYNTGITAKRAIDKLNPLSKTTSYDGYRIQLETTGTQIQELEKRISHIKDQIRFDRDSFKDTPGVNEGHFDDPSRLADLDIFETLLAEKKAMYDKTNEYLASFEKSKRTMATGTYNYTGIDGTVYTLPEAFGGPYGPIHWDNSSSENSYLSLVDRQAKILSGKMVDTGFGAVTPQDPNYWMEWAKTLNNQFGNSQVARMLAAGDNPYEIITWLRSIKGKTLRNRLDLEKEDAKDYVLTAKNLLDQYLPDELLQTKLAERAEITPEMLRQAFREPESLPTIHGHVIAENLNLVGAKKSKNLINSAFRLIGSMPEDAWARHPVYAELYKKSLQQRIDDFTALNGRPVSDLPDELISSSELQLAMRAAHADALRGTKQLLFTIDRKTNLASFMKYISPFFSAYENSVKTWAKLAYDKPQLINRANLAFTAPNRAGIATDENGKPVAPENATMDDYIWVEVPESLKKIPFIGKGLSSLDNMGVQKRSLDVIFQGSTEIPVGPYVAIPVSEIVKTQPTFEDSLKWAIPFGPSRNAVTGMLPGWVRRQLTKSGGQSDPQYANTYALIWQAEQYKRKSKGLPPLSDEEVKNLTDSFYNMRTVANLVLPFAPTFTSPYKYYIDQYRQYQEKFKKDAPTEFWKTYGDDFFIFTMSLSKNNTGIGSSVDDVTNAKRYKDLVAEVSHIDPKLIGLITSNGQGAYKFSQAAYMWEQQNTVSPGSDLTFRGRQSPQDAAKDNETKLGWIKYRQAVSQLDTILQQRGLTSYQQNGAEDLQLAKNEVVKILGKQNNAWYDDYNSNAKNGYQNVIKTLNLALNDKKFMADHGNDSTWKSIRLFLDARQQIAGVLARQDVKDINSRSNLAIRLIYDTYINGLKQDDIGFSDLYERYFSNDPVYDKVYTEVNK